MANRLSALTDHELDGMIWRLFNLVESWEGRVERDPGQFNKLMLSQAEDLYWEAVEEQKQRMARR